MKRTALSLALLLPLAAPAAPAPPVRPFAFTGRWVAHFPTDVYTDDGRVYLPCLVEASPDGTYRRFAGAVVYAGKWEAHPDRRHGVYLCDKGTGGWWLKVFKHGVGPLGRSDIRRAE